MYKQLNRYREAKGRVRIVKYSRCSSDEQKKNGYTVKDQLDFIGIFAKENDLFIKYNDTIYECSFDTFLSIFKESNANRFLLDPEAFLNKINE